MKQHRSKATYWFLKLGPSIMLFYLQSWCMWVVTPVLLIPIDRANTILPTISPPWRDKNICNQFAQLPCLGVPGNNRNICCRLAAHGSQSSGLVECERARVVA